MATLAIYRGDQLERRVEIDEAPLRIGRAPENDLVLEGRDKGVSRAHAEIRYERGRYVIVDLDSQNGVWFGERRVKQEDLSTDVPVTIGPYRLVLERAPEAAPLPGNEAAEDAPGGGDEVVAEPTQMSQGNAANAGTAATPDRAGRKHLPLVAMVAGGILAAVVLVVAVTRRGATPDTGPAPTTTSMTTTVPPSVSSPASAPAPEPTPRERFKQHYDKAQELIAAGDPTAAKAENDLAVASLPQDDSGLQQRDRIVAMLNPSPPGAPGSPAAPTVPQPRVPSGMSEFQTVVRRPRERPADFNFRQKVALDHLNDGRAAMVKGDYARAMQLLEAALTQSGRPDFGRTRNEVRDLIQEAQNARNAQQNEQKKAEAGALLEDARRTAATDLPGAMRLLQRAQKVDADAPGLGDLIKGIQTRAETEGQDAFVRGKNLSARGRNTDALRELDNAVQLLELVPGGHRSLNEARQIVQELRKPK